MHSHIKHLYLDLYFGSITAIGIIWLVVRGVIARRAHQRVAGLLDVFDAGTAKVGRIKPVPGYYSQPNVVGLFHGRPASISTQSGLVSNIQFCVSSHSRMPFEVRPKRPPRLGEIRKGLKLVLQRSVAPIYIISLLAPLTREITFWKITVSVFLFFIALNVLIGCYAKWMGYDEDPSKDSRWEVSLPGSAPLLYTTYSPTRFRAMIERPELQEPVAHLFSTCQFDLLRSPGLASFPQRSAEWIFTVEVNCFYDAKLLLRDAAREVLSEISTLCVDIEQIRRSNESPDSAASQPV